MVPQGYIPDIRYVLFVDPQAYYALDTAASAGKVARLVGRFNTALAGQSFICVGPGRWGTANPDLGVHRQLRRHLQCQRPGRAGRPAASGRSPSPPWARTSSRT